MSTNFFSSLSGKFDLNSSMSNLYGDYNTIKSGAYSTLMKSYVNKVGNKAALQAYQKDGTTATTGSKEVSENTYAKKSVVHKKNFLDDYGKGTDTDTGSKYEKYKSSWLDDQLKQYDKDATKTTAADTSVSVDTTI
ncbi:MAG: hypothetical protein K6G10_10720 [Butyrivibrio sp.]|nr:hypothetical protein [Butyrivibrio sp.]